MLAEDLQYMAPFTQALNSRRFQSEIVSSSSSNSSSSSSSSSIPSPSCCWATVRERWKRGLMSCSLSGMASSSSMSP